MSTNSQLIATLLSHANDPDFGPLAGLLREAAAALSAADNALAQSEAYVALINAGNKQEPTVSLSEYNRLQDLVTSQGIRLMEYESEPSQAEAQTKQEPVAWAAIHFGGPRSGRIYSAGFDTREQAEDYITGIHQSNDSITLRAAPIYTAPQPAAPAILSDIEQYRQQMAGISTAALGYWKEGDSIHPDYDTPALREVAQLYTKYESLAKAAAPVVPADVERDAARYRWLRDGCDDRSSKASRIAAHLWGLEWDDAIDAAMLAAAPQEADAQPAQPEPVAWMVYTQDGKSVFVTDNPTDIPPNCTALPLFTESKA